MASWLDIIGSFIIGAVIILLLANINLFISSSAADNLATNIAQLNLKTTGEIIENDFYKLGYRVGSDAIAEADSDRIKFYGDLNNDTKIDTVYYYLGPTSEMSSSKNPDDRILYRVINNATPTKANVVTKFFITYYDSTGSVQNYGSLNSKVQRNKIRIIKIYLKVESQEPVEGAYQAAEWLRKITPKNL